MKDLGQKLTMPGTTRSAVRTHDNGYWLYDGCELVMFEDNEDAAWAWIAAGKDAAKEAK